MYSFLEQTPMLCPSCGSELLPDSRLCAKCGTTVEVAPDPAPSTADAQTASAIASDAQVVNAPPYAGFVLLTLGLGLCLSTAAFNATYNVAHGYWRVSTVSLLASALAVVLMVFMPRKWREIEKYADDLNHHKVILRRSSVFVLLFLILAAIIGAQIGKDGRETSELIADFGEMAQIGERITKARSSVEHNVPAHIVMYKQIEPEVNDFQAVLRKIHAELSAYDDRFPAQHEQTLRNINSVNVGLQRASLLQQQIALAREIESMDPQPRFQAWKERMQPLLDAEAALDKDLKD